MTPSEVDPPAGPTGAAPGPAAALRRIAYLLERAGDHPYRARAFRAAAATLAALPPVELRERAETGTLRTLPGIGAVTAEVITEALRGERPRYLARLEADAAHAPVRPATVLLDALRGDCHVHSDWSDGKATIAEMAGAARDLGHEYIVLSDHSPSLRIARGLSADRLRAQLDAVEVLNGQLAPFRILTGIEVDILPDGSLDQDGELLARLDVVVGSVHSLLRMDREAMTRRLLTAVANPHLDILGHCTGRMRTRTRDRPESDFDAERVFAACARLDRAVEVNSLPERRDPPRRLIRIALAAGCRFSIDSDAHSPGQLEWKASGCARAADCGVPPDRVVNTMHADELLAWARAHQTAAPLREAG